MRLFQRTRIAPTPSGYLHLGNLFSFILTAGLARKHHAKILLRIDDLDRNRMRKEYVEDIFETLTFLGIDWDEGPRNSEEFFRSFSQQHRLVLYDSFIDRLRKSKMVFACTCSRSQLASSEPGYGYSGSCLNKGNLLDQPDTSWRIRSHKVPVLQMCNYDGTALSFTLPEEMQWFVVRKKDRMASYQLASLADDIDYEVDLIVRGADLLSSTKAQLALSYLLETRDFDKTVFIHHSLMSDEEGTKLSKSAGALSIQYLRKQGMRKEDIYRHLCSVLGLQEQVSTLEELWKLLLNSTSDYWNLTD